MNTTVLTVVSIYQDAYGASQKAAAAIFEYNLNIMYLAACVTITCPPFHSAWYDIDRLSMVVGLPTYAFVCQFRKFCLQSICE